MFKLKFAPYFSSQKTEFLSLKKIPALELPECVEGSLRAMGDPERSQTSQDLGVRALWQGSLGATRPLLVKAVGFSFVASACAATSTLAAMRILKSGQSLSGMLELAFLYFLMNSLAQAAIFKNGRLRTWVGLSAETYLVGLISGKLLRLSSLSAARQSSGNLKTLITSDVKNVGQFLENAVRNLIPSLCALVVIAPLLVRFTGRAGIFGMVIMFAVLPFSLGLNLLSAHFQEKSQGELDSLTSLVGEWVKNVRLIRYLSWDEAFRLDVSTRLRKYVGFSGWQHLMTCLIFGFSITWWMVSITGVLLMARLLHYPLDMIHFFGSLWLMTFMAGYFTHLPNTIRLYGLAAPSMRRIAKLMVEEEQLDALKPEEGPFNVLGHLVPVKLIFEKVTFKYPEGKSAIQDFSFEFNLSSQLAVIGEIGSGKTTLLKLLCGEYPPSQGRILVQYSNGENRDLWTRSTHQAFRAMAAYVPQEPFVSSDLFSSNITLSEEGDASEALNAAYWAELEADIAEFPQGMAQEIGESGVNLSGGQRQRLNLARAIHANRSYLVLDDPLSAVDTRTEERLMERLTARGKGFVLVTHRTGELMRVESVMVMKEGRVVEQGTPSALAARPDSHFTRVLQAYGEEQVLV